MTKNVDDLRTTLFAVIEGVKSGSIPIENAKVIAELTQVVVNSAKVEVEFVKASNGNATVTGFLQKNEEKPVEAITEDKPALPPGILGVTVHRTSDEEPQPE